jgi:hypothetical protein
VFTLAARLAFNPKSSHRTKAQGRDLAITPSFVIAMPTHMISSVPIPVEQQEVKVLGR